MAIISKTGKELVWDLINQANPRPVPFSAANSVIEAITGVRSPRTECRTTPKRVYVDCQRPGIRVA